jgi:hypothetical protein
LQVEALCSCSSYLACEERSAIKCLPPGGGPGRNA